VTFEARTDVKLHALGRGLPKTRGMAREVGRGLVLLGLTGSSLGGLLGVVTQATRLLGR
jgi:hypothetical protein